MADFIYKCSECSCAHMGADADGGLCPACRRRKSKAADTRPATSADADVAKGLNYMEKPHRFTPGPGGNCLFCSHTQRWHTENRPKTPAEVEQEKKDRAIQEKNEDALGSALMLTPLPGEEDIVQELLSEQKLQSQVEQLAGAPLSDPNDPVEAAGVTDPKVKASMKRALAKALAEKMIAKAAEDKDEKPAKADSAEDAPLVNVTPREDKKAGGISEVERQKLADEGVAMEDGTFPVRDERDLKMALKLWGKATDPHEAREHIIVRAVELGLEDLLPQNFKDHQESSKKDAPAEEEKGAEAPVAKSAAYAITKSADEKRYTLGPMYIPDRLDAHNEFTTADELQKAVWEYTRNGDRRIRLQHNTDIVAGECVEVLSWPEEMTTTLSLPTGTLQKASSVTFPAGTTYMGIVWEPWAWELVKKGKITGLSMGGWAKRTTVTVSGLDEPAPDADPHVLKFNPDQPRDARGRWTDGTLSFKPGNWFDRHVMGSKTVATDQSPTSVSPSREAGNSAANIIAGRKKWTGPYDHETKTYTPYDPKTAWRNLPEEKQTALESFLTDLGAIWAALKDGSKVDSPFDRPNKRVKVLEMAKALVEAQETVAKRRGYNPNQPRDRRGRWTDGSPATLTANEASIFTEMNLWHADDDDEDDIAAAEALAESMRPLTDAEYEAHVARLQETLNAHARSSKGSVSMETGQYSDTPSDNPMESLHSTHLANRVNPQNPRSAYTPERTMQHLDIIGDIIGDAIKRGVPAERKSWIAGGLPGAGKSSFIKDPQGQEKLGLVPDNDGKFKNALVLNPDDIKTEMIARGMAPDIPGTDPMERVGFLHEESSEITEMLATQAQAMGLNVVWDITAHSADSVGKRMKNLREYGYNDTTYFMLDVSLEHSVASAKMRHRNGVNRRRAKQNGHGLEERAEFGGRYVPEFVTMGNKSKKGNRSKMRDAFDEIATGQAKTKAGEPIGLPYRMILVDNEGYAKKVLSDKINSVSMSSSEKGDDQ